MNVINTHNQMAIIAQLEMNRNIVHSKTPIDNPYAQNLQTSDCKLTMAAKPEKEHQLFLLTKINHHKITLIAEINENNHSF